MGWRGTWSALLACVAGLAACGDSRQEELAAPACDWDEHICSAARVLGQGYLGGFLGGSSQLVVSVGDHSVEVWSADGATRTPAFPSSAWPQVGPTTGLVDVRTSGRTASLTVWDPDAREARFVSDDLMVDDGKEPQFGVCGSRVWYWARTDSRSANCAAIRVTDIRDPDGVALDLGYGCHTGQRVLAAFAPDCRSLFLQQNDFDLSHHDLATNVTTPLPGRPQPNWTYLFSDDGGTIAYRAEVDSADGKTVENRLFTATGSPLVVREIATGTSGFRLSSDGSAVTFHRTDATEPHSELYVATADGRTVLVDVRASWTGAAVFSPDGRRIAYLRPGAQPAKRTLAVKDLDTDETWDVDDAVRDWELLYADVPGDAPVGELAASLRADPPPRFSSSGRTLVYFGTDGERSLRSFDLETRTRTVHAVGPFYEPKTAGDWLAFKGDTGSLWLADLRDDRPARVVSRRTVWTWDLAPDALAMAQQRDETGPMWDVTYLPLSRPGASGTILGR